MINTLGKSSLLVFEDEIIKDQIAGLPGEFDLKRTLDEYHKRETKEAKIAKDADLLDQILLLKEYILAGNKEAVTWLKDDGNKKNKHYELLYSKSAKLLAREIMKQNPSDCWKNLWTEKRR